MLRIPELEDALTTTELWVDALRERMDWHDRRMAYQALVATLHALRDRLSTDEVVYLGAELPSLLRGIYYDGWHPTGRPLTVEDRSEFLDRIHEALHRDPAIDAEQVARDVLAELALRLPAGELEDVRAATPKALRPSSCAAMSWWGVSGRPGDIVVLSVHWGANWGYEVFADERRFAHRLIDGGVDIVHGHSSHHAKAIEFYRNRAIALNLRGGFVNG